MKFIDFRDHCVIERETNREDEWNNRARETIYDGECLYEEGGSSYSRTFTTRTPTLFIPGVDVQVRINDHVKIETEYGREINSIVKIVRDINMPWRTGVKVTRIELKQAQGD